MYKETQTVVIHSSIIDFLRVESKVSPLVRAKETMSMKQRPFTTGILGKEHGKENKERFSFKGDTNGNKGCTFWRAKGSALNTKKMFRQRVVLWSFNKRTVSQEQYLHCLLSTIPHKEASSLTGYGFIQVWLIHQSHEIILTLHKFRVLAVLYTVYMLILHSNDTKCSVFSPEIHRQQISELCESNDLTVSYGSPSI
jgi:hypothetical protein